MIHKKRILNTAQCVFGTAEQLVMIFLMYKISEMTDFVVSGEKDNYLEQFPILIVAMLVEVLLFYIEKSLHIRLRVLCGAELRNKIYDGILSDDLQEDEDRENRKGNILNIYNSQIENLASLAPLGGEFAVAVLTLIFASVYMGEISLKLLLVSMVCLPVSGHIYERLMLPLQQKNASIMNEKTQINKIIKENLNGFYIVKAFCLANFFGERFEEHSKNIRNIEREKDRLLSVLSRTGILLRYMPQLIIPLYGGWLTYHGEMSVGELVAANTVIWYVILPIEKILNIRKRRKEQKPVIENVTREIEKAAQSWNVEWDSKEAFESLELENLKFGYSNQRNVLHAIDLKIKKGEHVLLLGESGNGKSTLAKILCGMETGYDGKIKVNGAELPKESAESIRKWITYVPQSPYIFAGSILENICMGRDMEGIVKEEIRQAAEISGVAAFAEKFPEQYETQIGVGGIELSGGQKKRIAMARAILAGGEMYILDEPTESLDEEGGKILMKKLKELWADKAMLIISHNMANMPQMDAVYTIQKGTLGYGYTAGMEKY